METNKTENELKSEKKSRAKFGDGIFFAALLVLVFAVSLWLFDRQTTECMGAAASYFSDMKAYILEMQGLESGYSFPYPIFFKTAAFLHLFIASPEFSVALATALFNCAAIVIVRMAMGYLLGDALERAIARRQERNLAAGKRCLVKQWMCGALLSLVAVSLFFISMVYPPSGIYLPGILFKYLGVFSPNPFHNATYMAARPFAILAFLWFAKLLPIYEEEGWKKNKKDYLFFSLFLLLSTMTKPSFTIVLVGTAGIIMVWRMVRKKFQNFLPTVWLGLTFVPTFLDLLYQYKGVFVPTEGEEGGVGFTFGGVWRLYCNNIPLAIGLAIGFPILVLLCNWKRLKTSTLYRFSWQIYAMGFLMTFFLYEKGFRRVDFNFSWGYMYGIFFAHFGALIVLLQEMVGEKAWSRKRAALIALQWAAYLVHLVCGTFFFLQYLSGAHYY